MRRDKAVFKLVVDDVQNIALRRIDRKLTYEEMDIW